MQHLQEKSEAFVQCEHYNTAANVEICWGDLHNCNGVMDGYKPFRRDRQVRRGGEIALHLRESFDCLELNDGDNRAECLQVRIKGMANKTDRPPNQEEKLDKIFYKELGEVLLSPVLALEGEFELIRYLLEIQPSREETVQEVPGVCGRDIPDTAGESVN
ncbi:mitochondrial fission process protein 1 [Pitangus sulphuratus]|nr:mitochondrial fission process protein 1 [Pitangus sulphuratus]